MFANAMVSGSGPSNKPIEIQTQAHAICLQARE